MANSLNRDLKTGDKLVLTDGTVCAVSDTITFGAFSFTSGTALIVQSTYGPEQRVSGYDVDAKATMERFGKDNGWVS